MGYAESEDHPVTLGWNDELKATIIKVTENWIVGVAPMIFNDRIILMEPDSWQISITAGFCYDKGAAAVMAALLWDPETQRYPEGYKKIAYDGRPKEPS